MNAISLLSGWSAGPAAEATTSTERPLKKRKSSSDGPGGRYRGRRGRSLQQDYSTEPAQDAGHEGKLGAGKPGSLWQGNRVSNGRDGLEVDPEQILKPPESREVEKIEASSTNEIDTDGSAADFDVTSIYPSPPPTPPLPLPTTHINPLSSSEISSAQYVLNKPAPDAASPVKSEHSEGAIDQAITAGNTASTRRQLNEYHARIVVNSYPARYAVRFYLLVKRFLALFGIYMPHPQSIPDVPHLLSSPPVRQTDQIPLSHEIVAQPPSSTSSTPTAALRDNTKEAHKSRWRFPGLGGSRKRKASNALLEVGNDTSSESSVLAARSDATRRSDNPDPANATKKAKSSTHALGHTRNTSRVSQIALSKPKMLVLDLDETLIHSTSRMGISGGYGPVTSSVDGRSSYTTNTSGLKVRVVEVVLDGRSVVYHVYKRPWVDFFLRKVSSWYTVIVFTASMKEYADPVIDWLDQGRGMINGRLFRESCTFTHGSYVKDLSIVDPDLARVCLVDNSPASYAKNQANGIPIEGWINDPNDEALLDLLPMLDSLRFTTDVRHILGLRLAATSTIAASRPRRVRSSTATSETSSIVSTDEEGRSR